MRLYTINLDTSALQKLGLPANSKTSLKLQSRVNELAGIALNAFKSKVPVDTGELRDDHIMSRAFPYARKGYTAEIYVDDYAHLGTRGKSIPASELSSTLDTQSYLTRTQDSRNIPPFSKIRRGTSTAGWIYSGKQAFNTVYRRYLNA